MTGHEFLQADGGTSIDEVIAAHRAWWPGSNVQLIYDAYQLAEVCHRGQYRRSGDPFITHPVAVAKIVAEAGGGEEVVCAALLHDVFDGDINLSGLRARFPARTLELVTGLADLDRHPGQERALQDFLATADGPLPVDRDVLLLKLADRLHNMRTVRCLDRAKQRRKSRQTVDVLAPLAKVLGLPALQLELTNLAHEVLHPTPDPRMRAASMTVTWVAALLPKAARQRWAAEWTAELAALPSSRRRHAFLVRLLMGMPHMVIVLHFPTTGHAARDGSRRQAHSRRQQVGVVTILIAALAAGSDAAIWASAAVLLASLALLTAVILHPSDRPNRRLNDLIRKYRGSGRK